MKALNKLFELVTINVQLTNIITWIDKRFKTKFACYLYIIHIKIKDKIFMKIIKLKKKFLLTLQKVLRVLYLLLDDNLHSYY